VIQPIDVNVPIAGATSSPTTTPSTGTPSPVAGPRAVNSKLPHADALAWSPDASLLAMAVNGGLQIYRASGKDGAPAVKVYLSRSGVSGLDWSGPIQGQSYASVKPAPGPQAAVDGLLKATKLPAAADSAAGRYATKVYLWQFDSSKASPVSAIADATPSLLQQYPPIAATVVFHHWAPSGSWALLGGCRRYRVVIKGSVPPLASTFGLGSNALCGG
jgi:hypothetical protein